MEGPHTVLARGSSESRLASTKVIVEMLANYKVYTPQNCGSELHYGVKGDNRAFQAKVKTRYFKESDPPSARVNESNDSKVRLRVDNLPIRAGDIVCPSAHLVNTSFEP